MERRTDFGRCPTRVEGLGVSSKRYFSGRGKVQQVAVPVQSHLSRKGSRPVGGRPFWGTKGSVARHDERGSQG